MLRKILAHCVIITLSSSLCLAQAVETVSGPGTPLSVAPVTEEAAPLVLNSASAIPAAYLDATDVVVQPFTDTAVITFSTGSDTHAMIEYGLTKDYNHSLITEIMSDFSETLGELEACTQYFYRINVGETPYEGEFRTIGCPLATKKIIAKPATVTTVPLSTPAPTPAARDVSGEILDIPETGSLERMPELNAAPEVMPIAADGPEAPESPTPIQADDVMEPDHNVSASSLLWLILFAILSGSIVLWAAKKNQKKWFQF